MSLMIRYQANLERLRGTARILPYRPPCCNAELEMHVPDRPGVTWDSLMNCPNCGEVAMKVVTYDTVGITLLETTTNEEK